MVDAVALTESWAALWNNDLSLTPKIIAEDFVAHAAPLTGVGSDRVEGRDGLDAWVSGIHGLIHDLVFTIEIGPIAQDDFISVRWRADGVYAGGFPGGSDNAIGRAVRFTGTDTLRLVDGLIAEYWANADSLLLVQQFGVREVPGYQA